MNTFTKRFFGIAICLFACSFVSFAVNTITTGTITGSPFCPGDSVLVPFTKTGAFISGNVFRAQLSDPSGSFALPTQIGFLTDTTAGTIHCRIPQNSTAGGTAYRIRVVSTTPVINGADNGVNLTVRAAVVPLLQSQPSNATVCSGDSVMLYNTAGGLTSFQWYRNNVLITGATSATYYAFSSGTYTLVGSNGLCPQTSNLMAVSVLPGPTMSITGDTLICIGNSANMSATGSNYQYTWSPANALNLTNVANVSASPTSSTTYTVTGTNINGCSATATFHITVNPNPSVSLTVSTDTVCPGGSATIIATGADLFFWSPANTLSSGVGDTVIATPTASTMYQVIAKNNGCTNLAYDSVYIVVSSVANIFVTGFDSICLGTSTQLIAHGGATYDWSPATGLNTTTGDTVIANPTINTVYTVTGHLFGCVGTTTETITIRQLPTIVVTGADTICINNSTTLTASGAQAYSWSPSYGLAGTNQPAELANPTITTTY
ncbi:MAG: hypothetical protein WCL14_07725, partial [Bacteroidota bacterium]